MTNFTNNQIAVLPALESFLRNDAKLTSNMGEYYGDETEFNQECGHRCTGAHMSRLMGYESDVENHITLFGAMISGELSVAVEWHEGDYAMFSSFFMSDPVAIADHIRDNYLT